MLEATDQPHKTPNGPVQRLNMSGCTKTLGKSLITPDQQENVAKKQSATMRRTMTSVRQQNRAVAADTALNGTSDLSAELQANIHATGALISATVEATNDNNTDVESSTSPPVPKRRRTDLVPNAPAALPGPAKNKCQGCPHGDLLEMKLMETRDVSYYVKPHEFLEHATCAGECKKTIKHIHQSSKRATLYFCDEALKGFRAPEDDLNKPGLECGLILCVPCHTKRAIQYALDHGTKGTSNRRNSRRGTINK